MFALAPCELHLRSCRPARLEILLVSFNWGLLVFQHPCLSAPLPQAGPKGKQIIQVYHCTVSMISMLLGPPAHQQSDTAARLDQSGEGWRWKITHR